MKSNRVYSVTAWIGIILLLTITSCSPTINSKLFMDRGILPSEETVVVYKVNEPVPNGADTIGTLKIGDSGFTSNCSYDTVIGIAKSEARWMGGNIVKLTEHKPPMPSGSSCHRIKADVLYLPTDSIKEKVDSTLAFLKTMDSKKKETIDQTSITNTIIPNNIRIAAHGGFAYMVAPLSDDIGDDFKDYSRELKTGKQWSADIQYYLMEVLGIGLKYSQFNTSNSLNNVYLEYPDGTIEWGRLADDITISYFGPMFSLRVFDKNKANCFVFGASAGYMGYKNNSELVEKFKITGNTIGFCYDLSYDIKVAKNLYIGLQASWHSGFLTKYEIEQGNIVQDVELEVGDYEGLARLDLSAGVRIGF